MCVYIYIYICMYILYPFIHLTNIYRESLYTRHCPRCWGYSRARFHGAHVRGVKPLSPAPHTLPLKPTVHSPSDPSVGEQAKVYWQSSLQLIPQLSEGRCLPECPSGFTRWFHVKNLMRELPGRTSQVSLGHSRSPKRPTPREGPNDAGLGIHPSQPQTWVGTNPLLWRFSS